MRPVRLSKDAANYIRREADYLRQRNPAAARNFSLAMKNARGMLQDFPETGNRAHGLQLAGCLTLVVGDYLLDYVYDGDQVSVLAVRHARMAPQVPDLDVETASESNCE